MPIICDGCSRLIRPTVDRERGEFACADCGHRSKVRMLPLFVVTGMSGSGKSAVVPHLRKLLPQWDVFDSDVIFWDGSPENPNMWLTVAHNIAQCGRPTLLCGYLLPSVLAACESYGYFSEVHYLLLNCQEAVLEKRLAARPAWRGFDAQLIREHRSMAAWLGAHPEKMFGETVPVLDTTHAPPEETARGIMQWATAGWDDFQHGRKSKREVVKAVSQNGKKLDPEWRKWVAQCRLMGLGEVPVLQKLLENGIDRAAATAEMQHVALHPYVRAGLDVLEQARRKQIEGAQATVKFYGTLAALVPGFGTVERRGDLTRPTFLRDFYTRNYPVILTGLMKDWKADERWTPAYIKEKCGNYRVRVQTPPGSGRPFDEMDFHDYVDSVHTPRAPGQWPVYMFSNYTGFNRQSGALMQDVAMCSEFLDAAAWESNIQMLYGPPGAVTPLHQDPKSTMLAQVRGRKRVKMIPPFQADYVYDKGNLFSPLDADAPDLEKYPDFAKATVIEFVLEPGEVLFLPALWWHHVRSLDQCVSVSFENLVFPNAPVMAPAAAYSNAAAAAR